MKFNYKYFQERKLCLVELLKILKAILKLLQLLFKNYIKTTTLFKNYTNFTILHLIKVFFLSLKQIDI